MLLHPSSHTTSTQCGLIKSQGLSLEDFGCAGSCSGRGKGKEREPLLLFSQCTLFPSFSPLLPQSPLVAESQQLCLTSVWGWADRRMLRAEVTEGGWASQAIHPQDTGHLGDLGRGVLPLHNWSPHQDLSMNPGHRVHISNSGFTALNRKQRDIPTIGGAFVQLNTRRFRNPTHLCQMQPTVCQDTQALHTSLTIFS